MGLLDFAQSASNAAASNVSGPVDLLAWALRKAGVPVGDAPVGSSAWMARKGLTREVPQSASSLAGETFGLLAPVVAAAKAPQIAKGLLQAGENLAAPANVNRGASSGQRGIFMGDLSKTWDKDAAAKAQAMEKAGKGAREIWQETGTFKGVDGRWRQEIPDNNAIIKGAGTFEDVVMNAYRRGVDRTKNQAYAPNVNDVLMHPRLNEAYPDVALIEAQMMPAGKSAQGALAGEGKDLVLHVQENLPSDKAQSTILHELQHAIQQRQGWERGGSPVGPEITNLARQSLANDKDSVYALMEKTPEGTPAYQKLRERLNVLLDLGNEINTHDIYKRLAGEAEARAVQARMNMTPAERRATFPFDSYDVPVDSLIVRGLLK